MVNLNHAQLPQHRRILAIDDNLAIHEDYRKVLLQRQNNDGISETEAILFDEEPIENEEPQLTFEIDSAMPVSYTHLTLPTKRIV